MIKVSDLKKKYKGNTVLNDVNICIPQRKISFLMGKNGAGKTTFIKCLVQLEKYEGNIIFDGKDFQEIRGDVLVIYDDAPLYSNLSGLENLVLLNFKNANKKVCFDIALKYLSGDILKRKVSTYSYGQRKRLYLAIAEISAPKYLIMDEISNGLDYETIKQLKKDLSKWSENMTIILTGHHFDFYNQLTDELFIINDSKMNLYNKLDNNYEDLGEIYDENII